MKKILKIVLLIILALIVIVLGILFLPTGKNPEGCIVNEKSSDDFTSYSYNDITYKADDSNLQLPISNSGLVFKNSIVIKKVYTNKYTHFLDKFDDNYFMIGDSIIIRDLSMFSDTFFYYDTALVIPEISTENIKRIDLCQGNYQNLIISNLSTVHNSEIHQLNSGLSYNLPTTTDYYLDSVKIVEEYTDKESIKEIIDVLENKNNVENAEENLWYRIEFNDESFPFYMVVCD